MTELNITQEQYDNDIRNAKAQAWEEGKAAGASVNEGWEDTLTNPYRDKS